VIQMSPALIILVISSALFSVAAGIFALLAAGIRQGDRTHLASDPSSHADAMARRILLSICYCADQEEEQ
jgi:hypothetical protein